MLTEPALAAPAEGISANAFSSLFQAVNGLRNRRALVALLGCTFVGVLIAALVATMAGGALGMAATFVAMLVWFVAIGTGINAAGLLQMDEARGVAPRNLVDALVYGLMCIPKLIVLGLAFLAVEIAVFIFIALLMLVSKIPLLGALLFVVVFPLSVLLAGLTIVGVVICMVLSLPAIWQGATITRALAQTLAIVRSRLVEAVLLLVFVGLLCFVVGLIVFGLLASGLVPTIALAASIVGFGGMGSFSDPASMMAMAQGGAGGHAIAGAIGFLLLWAVAGSLVGQVYLRGLSLVYLRVTEGLDVEASEAALRDRFDDARRRTAELGEKARSATGQAAPPPAATGAPDASSAWMPPAPSDAAPGTHEPAHDAALLAAGGTAAVAAAAYSAAVPPAYNPTPAYNPPPAYSPPPEQSTLPPSFDAAPPADIDLSFDDSPPPSAALAAPVTPAAPAAPSFAASPAWAPPTVTAPSPPPEPEPAPVASTCPQCLSPVTPADVFCGVCGYRLK